MMRTCAANREGATSHALRHSGKSEPCVHREPTGRVIIFIVAEREEREDKRGKREEKESREREREKERRKNDGREEGTSEREEERGASRM